MSPLVEAATRLRREKYPNSDLSTFIIAYIAGYRSSASDNKVLLMWVNAPSTHQKLHKYHGRNVIAQKDFGNTYKLWLFWDNTIIEETVVGLLDLTNGWR